MMTLPMCFYCKRKNKGATTCAAYPHGIPRKILLSEVDHRLEYPDDHGLRFDPVDGAPDDAHWDKQIEEARKEVRFV